jgi:hypothetical protein
VNSIMMFRTHRYSEILLSVSCRSLESNGGVVAAVDHLMEGMKIHFISYTQRKSSSNLHFKMFKIMISWVVWLIMIADNDVDG